MGLFNWLFSKACRQVFYQVDVDKNGMLSALEIEVAILHLYNIFNKKLPGWQDPPTRELIQSSLKVFDADGNGSLDVQEFENFARQMLSDGPDMFFARIGKATMINTALLPAAGMAVQRAAPLFGLPQLQNVPLHFIAPFVGQIIGAVRSFIPV